MKENSKSKKLHRTSIIWLDHDDDRDEKNMEWFQSWLDKWGDKVQVAGYSTGGWEHLFDVQGTKDAIADIPKKYLSGSEWADGKSNRWGTKKSNMGDPANALWVDYAPNQILK